MPSRPLQHAVFLDRDGTLNVPVVRNGAPYPPSRVEDFALFPRVPEFCQLLQSAGFKLLVATNQPDVGRGIQKKEVVEAMHRCLRELIPSLGHIEVCYHGGEKFGQPCDCRKPKPGMLLTAAAIYGLDLGRSWMIGDRWRDIDCGRAAGCRTILIDHGYDEQLRSPPDFTVADFPSAVGIILAHHSTGPVH